MAAAGVLERDVREAEGDLVVERLERAHVDVPLEIDEGVRPDAEDGHGRGMSMPRTGGAAAEVGESASAAAADRDATSRTPRVAVGARPAECDPHRDFG